MLSLKEAVNIKSCNIDAQTNERLTHSEVYGRIINYLGGLQAVACYIPFTLDEIKKALKTDEHLNNLSMAKWDNSAGFNSKELNTQTGIKSKEFVPTAGSIWDLYRVNGINCASASEGVCILKEAAKQLAAMPKEKAEALIAASRPVRIITVSRPDKH